VLVTDWQEFQTWSFQELAPLMLQPNLIDGRNVLNPQTLAEAGFTYVGMGRPTPIANLRPLDLQMPVLALQTA
jgi:UDPglucose 6-dehydrogenase